MKKIIITLTIVSMTFFACKDKAKDPEPNTDKCATKTLAINADVTKSTPCKSDGSITITATGNTNFTYSIGSAAFQASNVFPNLLKGEYSITAKDADGCTATKKIMVEDNGTAGSNFMAVKALVALKCNTANCHGTGGSAPKIFTTDCGIVSKGQKMKELSVDGSMGSLNAGQKAVITDWLAAGGKFTD